MNLCPSLPFVFWPFFLLNFFFLYTQMEMVWLRSELQDQRDRLQEALLASQKQAAKAAQQDYKDGEGGGEGSGSPGSGGGGGSPGQHRAARSPRLRMPGSGGGRLWDV